MECACANALVKSPEVRATATAVTLNIDMQGSPQREAVGLSIGVFHVLFAVFKTTCEPQEPPLSQQRSRKSAVDGHVGAGGL
ncbi:hypothetical protein D3C76_1381160 [compost metagenome]